MSVEITAETYAALRVAPRRVVVRPGWSVEQRRERNLRTANAQARAKTALTKMFPAEYRSLYLLALDEVHAERGPLPGDGVAS